MYLDSKSLNKLDIHTKRLVIVGEYTMFKFDKDNCEYLIRCKDDLYFGLTKTGKAIKSYNYKIETKGLKVVWIQNYTEEEIGPHIKLNVDFNMPQELMKLMSDN